MSTVFKTTLKPVLILSKILELINFTYNMESEGLLIKNVNLQYNSHLEVLRMLVLLYVHNIYISFTYMDNIII